MENLSRLRPHLAIVFAVCLGFFLRVRDLSGRPMHADEAGNAAKFGTLLETGSFEYDPAGFHGPALHYAALPVAWLAGRRTYKQLDEFTLRLVPAIFGTLLILTPLLFYGRLPLDAVASSSLLLACSPGLIYYSRDFIPEILLVFFTAITVGCAAHWLPAGISGGLMFATKETAVIALAAVLPFWRKVRPLWLLYGALAAAAVLLCFLSPVQLLRSYVNTYFQRAFQDPLHIHPWHYYLTTIFIPELPILLLALASRSRYLLYPLLVLTIYSLIPYKTPWCVLTALSALTIPAALTRRAFILPAVLWLLWPSHSARYSYSETLPGVVTIAERLPAQDIDVISSKNVWPLPWYLRRSNVRYWRTVPENTKLSPVIIVTPEMEPALIRVLYELPPPGERRLYTPIFEQPLYLRPTLELRAYH